MRTPTSNAEQQPGDILWDDIFHINPCGFAVPKNPLPELSTHESRGFSLDPIYEYKGFAIKCDVPYREFDMAKLAGDCGVKVHGYVLRTYKDYPELQLCRVGLVMEIGRPLADYIKTISDIEPEKLRVKNEMISVVERLHTERRMVHGDIKPANFLICQDSKIRLCDFKSGRPEDEPVELWGPLVDDLGGTAFTDRYQNKHREQYVPPTRNDDWYALAISVWELYTGKTPFESISDTEELRDHRRTGQTVDLTEVKDSETREWIRKILREGDALA
ncbi:hypothetical protein TWF192_005770 [Orbilia oligospora]|uniref:non-specific serine/threonine protein kinase n=1 Tax=Orbilia oligospora TaxID=2813651 RepID=A0A6G1MP79_ORBOL|nr:hypothetical protein TWF679_002294 [Orbilia oligospora]KAF3231895.1 hypothetical protein TWF191_003871 [Orbilia oligospora]KAF3263489.1 hypothetical protein TWF192_005770 [Orbilia oligospora]